MTAAAARSSSMDAFGGGWAGVTSVPVVTEPPYPRSAVDPHPDDLRGGLLG